MGQKIPRTKKSLIQKCSNSLVAHKLCTFVLFNWFFFLGAYRSLPDAGICWCLRTGGGGVVTRTLGDRTDGCWLGIAGIQRRRRRIGTANKLNLRRGSVLSFERDQHHRSRRWIQFVADRAMVLMLRLTLILFYELKITKK